VEQTIEEGDDGGGVAEEFAQSYWGNYLTSRFSSVHE
jgi:hypothetical protein